MNRDEFDRAVAAAYAHLYDISRRCSDGDPALVLSLVADRIDCAGLHKEVA